MKLQLGYSISMPLNYSEEIPDYSVEDIELITKLSKKFPCIQVMFSKSNLTKEELKSIKQILNGYKKVFVHASYQINMGAELMPTQTDLYNIGIDILVQEIEYGVKIGMKGIVLHTGKNVKKQYDPDTVYNNMVKFIIELFRRLKSKKINTLLLLETPAGQGGEMLFKLEELVEFIQRFKNQDFYSKLKLCIDTCHIFQAGYDLNDNNVIKRVHKILEPVKEKIELIHLNDSYHQVGQHLDRHEQIGRGYINVDQLIQFIYPYIGIPMILETKPPYDNQVKLLE